MKYIVELYFNFEGDCLEQKEYQEPIISPSVGDMVYFEFNDPDEESKGTNWLVVRERRVLFFPPESKVQTIQLRCDPLSKADAPSTGWVGQV